MTAMEQRFLPGDFYQSSQNVGGVLAAFVRRKFPRDTIKRTALALDCTPAAAANVTKGHASERTITKAMQTWPWEFSVACGEAFSGVSYPEHLQAVIEREAHVQRDREVERERVRQMEARAVELGALSPRLGA